MKTKKKQSPCPIILSIGGGNNVDVRTNEGSVSLGMTKKKLLIVEKDGNEDLEDFI